jgi:hypothetical protein
MSHSEQIKQQQAENSREVRDMDALIDWSNQKELSEQAEYLRKRYGELRFLIESDSLPGGSDGLTRGTLLLACNVLMQGAEIIEDHYADQLGKE